MRIITKKYILCSLLGMAFSILLSSSLYGISYPPPEQEEIYMVKGDLEDIKTYDLSRISITNPEIADIVTMDNEHVLMIASKAGETTVFIWDKYGKRSVSIRVTNEDLHEVKRRMQQLLAKSETDVKNVDFEINPKEGKIIVTGNITKGERSALWEIIGKFEGSLLDFIKVKSDKKLIQIDAQVVEFTGSHLEQLGFNWTNALTYTEALPSGTIHGFGDIFKLGNFSRTTNIASTISAYISDGKGRVLSRPKLVVASGKSANFLVGGEIPVTETTTSSGGNVQESVSFKSYGIGLDISPTIVGKSKIDIQLGLQISDVDAGNSVGGKTAFTTRSTSTQIYVDDGQTIVIAGLLKRNEGESITKIPLLGDIPIVGMLFRNRVNPVAETETELVITLTPTILKGREETNQAKKDYEDKIKKERMLPTTSFVSEGAISSKVRIPKEMVSYMQTIQQRIAQRIIYPEKARRYGWEGTVKLMMHLYDDGSLVSAAIQKSSGYDLFDEGALKLIRELAPYSGFPTETGLQELTVTIPIVYSLDATY